MPEPDTNNGGPVELLVVLADANGNFYELSRAALETCKVSEERKAEIKGLIADALGATGYINHATIPGSIVANFMVPLQGLRFEGTIPSSAKQKSSQ